MMDDSTLVLSDESAGSSFLLNDVRVFYVGGAERGARGRYWMFQSLEDGHRVGNSHVKD
jgi:hypothetical protein